MFDSFVGLFFSMLILLATIYSCKPKILPPAQKKIYKNQISPEKIKLNIKADSNHKRFLFYREEVNNCFNNHYLNYLSGKNEIVFSPVFTNSPVFTISLKRFINDNHSQPFIVVKDSTIHIFQKRNSLIYTITIGKDCKINNVDSIDFDKYYDKKDIYIVGSIDQPFQVIGSTYFFPILSLSKRKKFVNDKSYLAVSKRNGVVKTDQVLSTPKEYIDGKRNSMVTFIYQISKKDAILVFQDIDRVIFFNTDDMNVTGFSDFNPYSDYEDFDYDKRRDLGYVRVYTETNEVNFKIIPIGEKFVVIKRSRRKNIHEKEKMEYLIVDKGKLVSYDSIPYNVKPFLSFPYKKGFVLVNSNMKDGYYYEIL